MSFEELDKIEDNVSGAEDDVDVDVVLVGLMGDVDMRLPKEPYEGLVRGKLESIRVGV